MGKPPQLTFDDLLLLLQRPEAFPEPTTTVEIRQTHISAVLLTDQFAYKLRKPVDLGFVDFRSVEQRRLDCIREVVLNRRLSPRVYLGVTPITSSAAGVQIKGDGVVIDWAVKMVRLPADATLDERLGRGEANAVMLASLAQRLATFHASAPPATAEWSEFDMVANNARENLTRSDFDGATVHPAVRQRLLALTEAELCRQRLLVQQRARLGAARDAHGDLRLEHLYYFPDANPPEDWAIIDAVEFSDRYRIEDPVADIAFVVMDLKHAGRPDLAAAFAAAYFAASGDASGQPLLPFYTSYRAAVRAKVESLRWRQLPTDAPERDVVAHQAMAHWLRALAELAPAEERPYLILVGGLPGAGKSTVAKGLSHRAGGQWLRTDLIRKELAGVAAAHPAAARFESGFYAPEWTERTYAECWRRAHQALFAGQRVIIDATFRQQSQRERFVDLGRQFAVPTLFIECQVAPEIARERIHARHGDASDADAEIRQLLAQAWEKEKLVPSDKTLVVDTAPEIDSVLLPILNTLKSMGLFPPTAAASG